MQQAWHILRKDIRYLFREIAFLLLLAAFFGWMDRVGSPGGDSSDALELLYVAAVAYTLARLVHAEAIPGENQFWITRPYRWPSLLAAKIVFVIAFVQLPVLLVQTLILLANGFPASTFLAGLFWTQVLIALAISLPCLALAAMTTGLVNFVAIVLVLLAIGFVTAQASFRSMMLSPESLDWVRHSIPFLAAAIAVPPVLYFQYRYRWTRGAQALAAGVALCGAIVFAFLPGPTSFGVQSPLSKQSFPVEITPNRTRLIGLSVNRNDLMPISLPLNVSGVPEGVRLQIEMYDLSLVHGGRVLRVGANKLALHRGDDNTLVLSGVLYPDRWFVDSAKGQTVALHVSLYLTLYGNARETTIPFQKAPVNALDGLRCSDEFFDEIICRSPFRWPARIESVKSPWGSVSSFTHLISYSPFPANLQLDPIAMRSAGPFWSKEKLAARQVTIQSEEPLQYLRRDIDIPDLSLRAQE